MGSRFHSPFLCLLIRLFMFQTKKWLKLGKPTWPSVGWFSIKKCYQNAILINHRNKMAMRLLDFHNGNFYTGKTASLYWISPYPCGLWTHHCWIGSHKISFMMTSSNGNIFRVTGPLCGEFTVYRWIPLTKANDAELWCFLWTVPEWTFE